MTQVTGHPSLLYELKALAILAIPLIVNNVAISMTSFIDVVMAGRLSAEDLAAVGIGSAVWATVFLFGLGVLMAVSATVAHLIGRGDTDSVGEYLHQSLYIATVLAVAMMIVIYLFAWYGLELVGITPEIIPRTQGYLMAIAWGLPLMYPFLCMRYTSEGAGHTAPIMFIALATLCVNFVGNYLLMFGKFGFPALGATGCGMASALSMWFSFFAMLLYVRRQKTVYGPMRLFAGFFRPDTLKLRELLGLGLPIGGSVVAEVMMFSAAALIMGVLGANEAAAHAVAINYAATMFMVPLALHSAITVRVGQSLGANALRRARRIGWLGIVICGVFMTISASFLIVLREPITGLYTQDAAVREIAVALLFMAMIFQISDGLQVGAAGALRGYKDAKVPLVMNIVAFWVVGYPVAYLAGLKFGLGPRGVWLGLAVGLTVAAILLGLRFAYISNAVCKRTFAVPVASDAHSG